jgi:hypothetical protein
LLRLGNSTCLSNKLRALWVLLSNVLLAKPSNRKTNQKSQNHRRLL